MVRMTLGLAAVILGVVALAPAHAADPEVTSVRVEPFVANIGDRITLTFVVEHEPGITIEGPGSNADFGELEFIEAVPPVVTPTEDGEQTTLAYIVTTFVLGSGATLPFEIGWRGPGVEGVLTTDPAPYTVDSVRSPTDNALRPLKAQFELPQPAPPPYVPATVVVLMAGLTALGYWLMRRAINTRPEPILVAAAAPHLPPVPADVRARAALDELAAEGIASTDPETYYERIASTVRVYLSARFDFPAYAMTRREMERGMTRAGIDRWPARVTSNLLEQCDAVQFAKFRPARERREQDLAAAYEIVEITSRPPASDEMLDVEPAR